MSHGRPVRTARELVRDRFTNAREVFLAGSVLTNRRTPTSDLDIVVLLAGLPAPRRESPVYRGRPAELFIQTEAVWHSLADQDTATRSSPLLAMRADGMLLVDEDGLGAALRNEARERVARGAHRNWPSCWAGTGSASAHGCRGGRPRPNLQCTGRCPNPLHVPSPGRRRPSRRS